MIGCDQITGYQKNGKSKRLFQLFGEPVKFGYADRVQPGGWFIEKSCSGSIVNARAALALFLMPPDNSEVSVRAGPFGHPMTHILSRKPTVTANFSDIQPM